MFWRLNRVLYPVYNLGPGKRIAIWTQGCPISCPGCISPDLQKSTAGREIPVEKILRELLQKQHAFTGVSVTGGEPFFQYDPLMRFCRGIKEKSDLDILVYSGYTLKELDKKFPDGQFRRLIDILVDGPYRRNNPADDGVRGSANQRILALRSGRKEELRIRQTEAPWSLAVNPDAAVFLSGIPLPGQLRGMEQKLEQKGIKLRFQ